MKYRGVVFLDGEPVLPKNAKFDGVMSFCKESGVDIDEKEIEINRNIKPCTCCGDVIRILECTSKVPRSNRNFTLYKTDVYDSDMHDPEKRKWCYFLLAEDDEFPIVVTEELANKILQNPDVGREIVINQWFDRYR